MQLSAVAAPSYSVCSLSEHGTHLVASLKSSLYVERSHWVQTAWAVFFSAPGMQRHVVEVGLDVVENVSQKGTHSSPAARAEPVLQLHAVDAMLFGGESEFPGQDVHSPRPAVAL